jgi:ADP-ribose pyrophosphatase YjhB (NUDIX family)
MGALGGDRPADWEGVAVLCASTDGHSLLMVLQGGPDEELTWAVPGGSVERGEGLEEAAIREVEEETGVVVRIVRPVALILSSGECGTHRVHCFQAEVVGGALRLCDPDGLIQRVEWVPAERLPHLHLSHEDQRGRLMGFLEEQ